MRTWFLLATAAMLLSFSGCEREKAVEPADVKQMLGNWRLVQPLSSYTTTMDVEVDQYSGGTISGIYSLKFTGKSAVNLYFTTARLVNLEAASIELESIGTTKMAGPAEAMLIEQTYYANLKAVNRYELTDKNRLKLFYQGGVLVYERTN